MSPKIKAERLDVEQGPEENMCKPNSVEILDRTWKEGEEREKKTTTTEENVVPEFSVLPDRQKKGRMYRRTQ